MTEASAVTQPSVFTSDNWLIREALGTAMSAMAERLVEGYQGNEALTDERLPAFEEACRDGADLPAKFLSFVAWLLVDADRSMLKVCGEEFKPLIERVASLFAGGSEDLAEWHSASYVADERHRQQHAAQDYDSSTPLLVAHWLAEAGFCIVTYGRECEEHRVGQAVKAVKPAMLAAASVMCAVSADYAHRVARKAAEQETRKAILAKLLDTVVG